MKAKLLMALTMGLTMLMAEVHVPQPAAKPLYGIKTPTNKAFPKHPTSYKQLTKKSPHAGYQITVQWIKEFGVSNKVNSLINLQPYGQGFGLMYSIFEGAEYSKYVHENVNKFQYEFVYLDLKGRRLWGVEYIPDKIRFVADFKMENDGKIYVLGWGGKRMDVWYIESFSRAHPQGKRVARVLVKDKCVPSALLSFKDRWVALGSPLVHAKSSKLRVWTIDKRNHKSTWSETTDYPSFCLQENEIYNASLPQFRIKKSEKNGWYLFNQLCGVDQAYWISPAFLIEHEIGSPVGDIVDVGDEIIISKGHNDEISLIRCDERCRDPRWETKLNVYAYRSKLARDGSWVVYATSTGEMGALNTTNGKMVWQDDYLGKAKRYKISSIVRLMKKPGAKHEYIRIGYRYPENDYYSQGCPIGKEKEVTIVVADVKVKKTAK
ncbi:hypothetical protein [Hydrogenimonas sp.]